MTRYFCHDHPDLLTVDTAIVEAGPGRALLRESPFYPGGGGQLADRGWLRWPGGGGAITGIEPAGSLAWVLLGGDAAPPVGSAEAAVDPAFRQLMRELHTALHIVNALVYQSFSGALVTGVQMNDDGTARIDFDLPDADNDRLRALEPAVNDAIRQDLPVRTSYLPAHEAQAEAGMLRSRAVTPPPTADGMIRVVEIVGLDRQACGGTHLDRTGGSRPVRILKVDNKGRHNRRVRIGLVGP